MAVLLLSSSRYEEEEKAPPSGNGELQALMAIQQKASKDTTAQKGRTGRHSIVFCIDFSHFYTRFFIALFLHKIFYRFLSYGCVPHWHSHSHRRNA